MSKVIGKVAQIIGPVVDVVFNGKDVELPKIYDSLEITKKDGTLLVLEVQSHIGPMICATFPITFDIVYKFFISCNQPFKDWFYRFTINLKFGAKIIFKFILFIIIFKKIMAFLRFSLMKIISIFYIKKPPNEV